MIMAGLKYLRLYWNQGMSKSTCNTYIMFVIYQNKNINIVMGLHFFSVQVHIISHLSQPEFAGKMGRDTLPFIAGSLCLIELDEWQTICLHLNKRRIYS